MLLFSLLTAAFAGDPDDLPEATTPTAPAPAPAPPLEDPEETPAPAPAPAPAAAPAPAPKGPATQSQIQQAVDAAYGKQVPIQAVCSKKVALGPPFTAEVVAFGVTQRNIGCKLFGVLVDAAPVPLADAVPAALGGGWSKLDSKGKMDALSRWTTGVLLTWDYVAPGVTPTVKLNAKGGWTATIPFTAHTSELHVSQDVPGSFTFDSAGKLLASVRDGGPKYKSDLYQTKYSVTGVDENVLATGIASVGSAISQCFEEKYQSEPTFSGPIRFAWTMPGNGSTAALGTVATEETPAAPDSDLSGCYAAALRSIIWPNGAKGNAVWSFTILRQVQ